MIIDGKKWHYPKVKSLSALLKGITSNHKGDFYCLNCFDSYRTEKKLKKHERVYNDHGYCFVGMPNEDNKILKYNYGEKSLKAPAIIYADLECLLEKMHSCQNNLEESYTEKKLSINLLVIKCLQIVHLMQQKANVIVTKGKTVWKDFVKI